VLVRRVVSVVVLLVAGGAVAAVVVALVGGPDRIAAAHHHRHRPAVGETIAARQAGQDPRVVAIAWRAQKRVNARWTHLGAGRGKHTGTVAVACARELTAFCWEAATLD